MNPFANEDSWEKFKYTHNLTEKHVLALQDRYKEYSVSVGIVVLLSVLYGIISLVAVIGNSLVMVVVITRKNMQTVTNIFIANLAFADVILGIFTIPFQFQTIILGRWEVAGFMCKVAPFAKNVCVNVSISCLTLVAIDRYIAVMYPLRAGFHKLVAALILSIIWIISIVASLPEALYYQIITRFSIINLEEISVCTVRWPSETFFTYHHVIRFLTQYAIPLLIITISYSRVARRIWGDDPPGIQTYCRKNGTRSRNKTKVVKMLIIVITLFSVCWLPLQIYNILVPFLKDKITSLKYINIIWLCSNWLAMSNAGYNPFIYGLLNEKFKKEFKGLFMVCVCCFKERRRLHRGVHKYQQYNIELTNQKCSTRFTRSSSNYRNETHKRLSSTSS